MSNRSQTPPDIIKFLKSVSTSTRYMDFATEKQLEDWPSDAVHYITELESIISRVSLEAEAVLWRTGHGQDLYPHLNKRGGL